MIDSPTPYIIGINKEFSFVKKLNLDTHHDLILIDLDNNDF